MFSRKLEIPREYFMQKWLTKDRNGMDLTEAEDIKKRWQKYTEKLYKKDLHDPSNHNGVITHLEPDILDCEVKWALESITMNKASRGNGIPVELCGYLKILWHCLSLELEWKWTFSNPVATVEFSRFAGRLSAVL